MVGLAGAVGDVDGDLSVLSEQLRFFGDERSAEYEADEVFVTAVDHPGQPTPQPADVDSTGERLWVWGDVYGHLDPNGRYVPRREAHPSLSAAEYVARLYGEHGESFVAGANGSFVCVAVDGAAGTLRLFTDRLGSRPVHHVQVDEGVVFSTQLQALCALLPGRLSFDRGLLTEYLSFERTLGLRTPVSGVSRAHPGAVTSIRPPDRSADVDVQWRPVYEPLDRPFGWFADRFAELFRSAVRERHRPSEETGVLLSGGSDSRLILGEVPEEGSRAYHINDWWNRETEVARRIADVAGAPFTFLERGPEHYERSIEFGGRISNYASWFQHAHAAGFADVLRAECDVLMTGHYSDTLYKTNYLPSRSVILPGTSVELPLYVERSVQTADDLVDMYLGTRFHNRKHLRAPPEFLGGADLRGVLASNIRSAGGAIDHHGVRFRSPRDAGLFSECYPLTNTAGRLFFDVMLQMAPFRDPFLDVRLVELMTRMPVRYRLRRNVVNAALGRLHPALADLPHPDTDLPLRFPFPLQYLALQLRWLRDRISGGTTPKPYYTQGSWPDWEALVRDHDLVRPTLEAHAGLLDSIEWIDTARVWDDYERHMAGEDRFDELSAVLSFLSMPATRTLLESRPVELAV